MLNLIEAINERLGGIFVDNVTIGHKDESDLYKLHVGRHHLANIYLSNTCMKVSDGSTTLVYELDNPTLDPEIIITHLRMLIDDFKERKNSQYFRLEGFKEVRNENAVSSVIKT